MNEDLSRRRILDELAAVHDSDAVAEADRLLHVVGDEDDRRRELTLDRLEVVLGLGPHQRVEAPNGSSISSSFGSAASARATPMRCCWPPESS